MTTSETSCSRQVTVAEYVSSNVYRVVSPTTLSWLKKRVESFGDGYYVTISNPNQLQETHLSEVQDFKDCRYFLAKCSSIALKYSDIVLLLERINYVLLSTPEGMSKVLEHSFGEEGQAKKSYGTELGQLRIFSDELMSFWTGKNWKKITLNEAKQSC